MNALEPVKAASDLLGSDDSDLLACETVIKFVLEELNAQCSNISRTLYEAIKNRVLERRNIDLTSLMLYLKGEKPKVEHRKKRVVHLQLNYSIAFLPSRKHQKNRHNQHNIKNNPKNQANHFLLKTVLQLV